MVFEIPDSKKSIEQNVFEVKAGSKTYKLPKFDYISSRQAMVFDDVQDDPRGAFDLLGQIATPKGFDEVLLDAPISAMQEFLQAWMNDSGVTPGESEASSA